MGPPTPEVGFAAVHEPDRPADRPRHARGPQPPDRRPPAGDGAFDDWYGGGASDAGRAGGERNGAPNGGWDGADLNGSDRNGANSNGAERNGADSNGSYRNGADRNGADRNGADSNGAAWNGAAWNGADRRVDRNGAGPSADWNGAGRSGAAWNDTDWNGMDRNGADRNGDRRGGSERATRHRDDFPPDTAHRADRYPERPYEADTYAAGPYPPDRYAPDPYAPDPYAPDPYGTASDRLGVDRYPADASGPGSYPERRTARSGPPETPGSRADRTGPPAVTDRYPAPPHEPLAGPDLAPEFEPGTDPDSNTGAVTIAGSDVTADPERRRVPQDRARGRFDAPGPLPDPDRSADAPASAAMPSRRPGDPPGAVADLFVETTAETPALTPELLGLHDRAAASTAAKTDEADETEEADETDQTDDTPPARRRLLGVPLPFPLPIWAARLGGAKDGVAAAGPGLAHGHGHGHGPARPAGRKVRILIAALLVPCGLATLVGLVVLWPFGGVPTAAYPVSQEPVKAQVTAMTVTDCSPGSGDRSCVALVVHMADGPRPGRDLVQVMPVEPGTPRFAVGDHVVLGWSGSDADDAGSYQVVDFQRGAPLAWLAGLFAAAVLVLGRWRGLAALAALGLSFVVLLFFVVPAILAGRDPLAVAVVGACLIMFAVLYLTHGPSARTSTAVIGTLLSLALIGALGAAFSAAAELTGLDDQTSNLIATLGTGVDARGLLLAGVVIGALGVLDDVTVTQTSAVWELRHANPGMSARGLFAAAMRIGRDHVASAVNTLVLAYAGAALPLLLLFSLSGRGFADVVTSQDVATEIVRTLVGSIGLVASVPITTALAAAVAARETVPAAEKAA
ncbi:putative membrane protein [Pseudonocardia cypriaca]|uniref:Putative membrane protein n=2 Tax=Pseudonocardia cypriaca TaxID=882449 RepID=A0A543GGP3_9PSEU|nr:putative membrane protein [Pseudonocardia cypriaca]